MNARRQQQFRFHLTVNQQEYIRYYQGAANNVRVVSECGRRLQFPASRLRPFITHTGISGRFQLTVDNENRFLNLQKIA